MWSVNRVSFFSEVALESFVSAPPSHDLVSANNTGADGYANTGADGYANTGADGIKYEVNLEPETRDATYEQPSTYVPPNPTLYTDVKK